MSEIVTYERDMIDAVGSATPTTKLLIAVLVIVMPTLLPCTRYEFVPPQEPTWLVVRVWFVPHGRAATLLLARYDSSTTRLRN